MERLRAALDRLRELDPNALPDPTLGNALMAAPQGLVLPAVKRRPPEPAIASVDEPPPEFLDAQADSEHAGNTAPAEPDSPAAVATTAADNATLPSLGQLLTTVPAPLLERIQDLFQARPVRVVRVDRTRLVK